MEIISKLNSILNSKIAISGAIEEKGIEVNSAPLSSYASLISQISSGGEETVQLGQIIEKNGEQKFVPFVFNGTEVEEGTPENFTELYTYNTVNPTPEIQQSTENCGGGIIYGVIYDPSSSSPLCQKVVMEDGVLKQVATFKHMPAHNFKRCVMDNLATRHINYYLDPYDSNYKEDGTVSVLTGADGDVMVEIPITYWSVTTMQDGKILYLISDQEFTGSEPHPFFYVSPGGATLRNQYVGAYEACLCDASGNPLDTSNQNASSSSTYQSGYIARSLKGTKPWTYASRATGRIAIHANGGYQINALFHQYLMLMAMIEGGSLNTQAAISPGYAWTNNLYAFTRFSGRCNYGNGTGNLMADPIQDSNISWQSDLNSLLKIIQFQYRGIENPWGNIWKFVDGIMKEDSGYYMTTDCSIYSDSDYSTSYTWKSHSWPSSGYIKTFDNKTFFAKTTGGSETTYTTDNFWYASGSCVIIYGCDYYGHYDTGVFATSFPGGSSFSNINVGFRVSA